MVARRLEVAVHEGKPARGRKRRRVDGRRDRPVSREQPLQVRTPLADAPSYLPVAPERGRRAQTDLRLSALGGPAEGGAEVLALRVEPTQPDDLLGAAQRRLG